MINSKQSRNCKRIIIFGAGSAGEAALKNLSTGESEVVAFFDNDKYKVGLSLSGIPIHHANELNHFVFDIVYIASEYFEQIEQQLVQKLCVRKAKIKRLPASAIKHLSLGQNLQTTELAESILFLVCHILRQENVPYYVDAGTLLGITRDQELIPWDDDLDIAISATDHEACYQAISTVLPQLSMLTGVDYQLQKLYSTQDFGAVKTGDLRSFKLTPINLSERKPLLDVFIKYKSGKVMDSVIASRGFRMPVEHLENLKWHDFKGHKISIPEKPELYLERHYGDWRTPVKEWDLGMLKNTTVFGIGK